MTNKNALSSYPISDAIANTNADVKAKIKTDPEAKKIAKWVHDRMYHSMNSVKHMRGWDDIVVDFDAKQEAGEAIDRAISNYMSLLTRIELPVVRGLEEFVNIGSLESST